MALLRSFGSEKGLYDPTDWKKAAKIDMIVETYTEVFNECWKILFETEFSARPAATTVLRDGKLRRFLALCEKQLQANTASKYISGDKMTIADIVLTSFIWNVLRNEGGPFSEPFTAVLFTFPFFQAYGRRMQAEFIHQLRRRKRKNIF